MGKPNKTAAATKPVKTADKVEAPATNVAPLRAVVRPDAPTGLAGNGVVVTADDPKKVKTPPEMRTTNVAMRLLNPKNKPADVLDVFKNGGADRGRLTDLWGSIEIFQDMRNLTLADVPESFRNQIFTTDEGFVARVWGINLHPMIELGVGQEYQALYSDSAGINGSLAAGDVELLVGLDLQRNDSFVHPIREELSVYHDTMMHRSRKASVYGWKEAGWGVMDNRRIILGSA